MIRRKIDVSRFLDAAPETPETPTERRNRIASALERAAETKGMIIENRRENDRLIRNHRKTKSDLFLDMRDLMGGIGPSFNAPDQLLPEERALLNGQNPRVAGQMLTEQFPTTHDDMIMQEYYQPQPQRQPQRQMLMEDVPAKPRLNLRQPPSASALHQPSDSWYVKKYLGETRGGDTVQIWKVTNKKTGTAIDKMFRLEGVATRIAMLMNESGNLNDPRVVSLITVYDKRDQLLKEARALEKSADGKPMKTERLRAIRAEINQLDYRLGL